MAIKLNATYSKKLGLPGYRSHQFSVSVETELITTSDVPAESDRLYQTLQQAVDTQMQQTGFVPDLDYGMNKNPQPAPGSDGPAPPRGNAINGNNGTGHPPEPAPAANRVATPVNGNAARLLATIDSSDNGVHQRTLNRLATFIDQFETLNFAADTQLEATLERFRRDILSRSAEDYRNNPTAMGSLTEGLSRLRESAVQLATNDARDVISRFGQLGVRKFAIAG